MMVEEQSFDTVGTRYGNYEVKRRIEITELRCILRELVHTPSGAQILQIENDDPENVFSLSFRTIPTTSNGVAHILEHTVLCGSDKFPVKDPFFAMNRRSLNTFMNAMTGADFTCYPAATQVTKDFYNLLDVYLDAVFHPKLDEFSFMQEGHRLEFSTPTDSKTLLERRGIVYNEMKGALSNTGTRLSEAINSALFPDITYGINSGGDPKHIPELSYQKLVDFHKTYYHPSRCLFFFYGNMPLKDHLNFLETNCLGDVEAVPPIQPISKQKRFTQPVETTAPYPFAPDQDDTEATIVSLTWLTCHILDQETMLALAVLETALMCTDASPLRLAIMLSGLCKQAAGYLDEDVSEIPFTLVMRGCKGDAAPELEKVICETLEYLVEDGIPTDHVDSAIHQMEFQRSEILGDHAPYGLSLFMRSALLKQHGGTPENGLVIHSLFNKLRERLEKEPRYLEELIRQYLLNNPHRVRVTLVPDKELDQRENAEERERLDGQQKTLSDEIAEKLIAQAEKLETFQKKQEDQNLEVLPKVTLADVPKGSRNYHLQCEKREGVTIYRHDCFTNEIVYADWYYPLSALKQDELATTQWLCLSLPQMGCGGRDYKENLEYLQANTGGVGMSMSFSVQADNPYQYDPAICITGKALHRKADKLFPMLRDMLTSADFTDRARLKEVVLRHFTGLQGSIAGHALRYAMSESASGLNTPYRISHLCGGLPYFHWLRNLAENFDAKADELTAMLQDLQQRLLTGTTPTMVLTCSQKQYDAYTANNFYGLLEMPRQAGSPWHEAIEPTTPTPQGRPIAAPIAFSAWALPAPHYCHKDAPALAVASNIFDNKVLHPRIREQGGAYGGGASSSPLHGALLFYGYRDPNISTTFDAFHDAINTVANKEFDERDLEEAKLEVIQSLDNPIAPGSRGATAYGWLQEGRTLEVRQAFRERLLSLTAPDVAAAVEEHLMDKLEKGAPAVFAGRELLDKENALLPKRGYPQLQIQPV